MSESNDLLVVACPHCHTLNRLPQQKLDQGPDLRPLPSAGVSEAAIRPR